MRISGDIVPDKAYDLLVNGQHIWSFTPLRDLSVRQSAFVGDWPAILVPRLRGSGSFELREHVAGVVVAADQHRFGTSHEPIAVLDPDGHPLLVDKWGKLVRPLGDESDEDTNVLLDAVERLLVTLGDACDVPGFICFGTLLGAVREGRLIGFDNDIDLAYLSEFTDPADIIRESYAVERGLRAAGWVVRRGSGVRLNVRLVMPNGRLRFIDVYSFGWVGDLLYMPSDVAIPATRAMMLPLGTTELVGRRLPAPADPEAILELTYGPGWRVPDPSFRYTPDLSVRQRFEGWYGGRLQFARKYWDQFASQSSARVPKTPSPFALWVQERYPSTRPIVDVGCGNGRDAVWFAEQQRRAIGLDYVVSWVNVSRRRARERGLPAEFRLFNLSELRHVLLLGAELSRLDEPPDVYARLLLSTLHDDVRPHLWRVASMALRRGGRLFVEFRTPRDAMRYHVFEPGKPKRRYLSPRTVVAEIEQAGGHVIESVTGRGLARFEAEDPQVCRVVAAWADASVP